MPTRTISNAGGNWNTTGAWVEGAVPTSADDVVATASSGNLTITATAACRSIDLTSYVGTLTHNASQTLTIGTSSLGPGSVALKFVAGMTYTKGSTTTSRITFASTVTGNTVDFAGKTLGNLTFNGSSGGWTLLSAATGAAAASTTCTVTAGSLNTGGFSLTFGSFSSSTSGTITLGASTITLAGANGNVWSLLSGTLSAGTSTIILSGTEANFIGNGATYATVNLTGAGIAAVTGANTFATFTRTGTAVKTDELTISATQTISGTLTLTGNSLTNRLFVHSDTLGTQRSFVANTVAFTNVDFQDILGQGSSAAVQSVATATATGTPTSLTITKPTGVVSGDLLVAAVQWYPGDFTSAPASWTLIDTYTEPNVPNFGGIATYYKIAGGSEPADYTFVLGTNAFSLASGAHGAILRVTGHDGSTPINANSIGAKDTVSPASTPSITTTAGNTLLLHIWAMQNAPGGVSWNSPVGLTVDANLGSSNKCNLMVAHEVQVATGATTSRDATASSYFATFPSQIAIAPAVTWTGTSLGDAGGNSGITFSSSVTRYWVGGSGSWSSTGKWSTSSGGSSGASVPLPQDDVIINSASSSAANQTMTGDMPRAGRNLTVSAPGSGNMVITGTFAITGSLTSGNLSTSTISAGITFWGRSSHVLTAQSSIGSGTLTVAGPGGTYTFTTAFTTTGIVELLAGTLDVGTVDVTCLKFDLNPTGVIAGRIFNMNARTMTVTGTSTVFDASVAGTPGTINAGTSTVIIANTSSSSKTINLNGSPDNTLYDVENLVAGTGQINFQGGFYHNVKIGGGTRTVQINSGGDINVSNLFQVQSATGAIITLSLADSITVGGTWDVDGQFGALGVLQSANSNQQTINMPAGVIASSYLSISNSIAVSPTYETTMPSIRTHTAATTLAAQSWPGQVPASAEQGDLLIALIENAQNVSINTPSGWSERHDVSVPNSAGQARFAVYVRTCRFTDPSTSFNWTPSTAVNQNVRVYIFAIQDAYQGVLSAMNTQSSSSAVQTWTGSQVTTTVASTIIDFLFARYSDNGALFLEVTMPTGATKYLEDNLGAGDAGGDYVNTVLQRTQSLAGAPTAVSSYGRAVTKTGWFAALQVSVTPQVKVYAGETSTDGGGNIGWRFENVPDVTIVITSPDDGSTQSNSVIVEATVAGGIGDEVTSVQFFVDGVEIGEPVTSITHVYTKTIDISTYLDGDHTVTAQVNY